MEQVKSFTCFDGADGGALEGKSTVVSGRQAGPSCSFTHFRRMKMYDIKTKIRLFNTNIKASLIVRI
jgi:hypothetical protein